MQLHQSLFSSLSGNLGFKLEFEKDSYCTYKKSYLLVKQVHYES